LRSRISALPTNPGRQDWNGLPLYVLIDHLTANHRDYRRRDLPDIHRLLESLRLELPSYQEAVTGLLSELTAFRQEFAWHMEEEEEFLFPKILRTEASLRHPDLYPEIFKGSVSMFTQTQIHNPEETFHGLVADIFLRLRAAVSDARQHPLIKETLGAIRVFESRLRAHTYVEAEILFPRALVMEAQLLQRAAHCD
jgi:iron-sulfur cluster repair protein YtfE (RIC family)